MGDVQFEEFGGAANGSTSEQKGLTGLLFRYGIVSTDAQAQKVLIGIIVIVLGITAYVLFGTGSSAPTSLPANDPTMNAGLPPTP